MSEKVISSPSKSNIDHQSGPDEKQVAKKDALSLDAYTDQQLELLAKTWEESKNSQTPMADLRNSLTASGEFSFMNQYKTNNVELRHLANGALSALNERKEKARRSEIEDILSAVSGKSTYADKRAALSEKLGFRKVYDMSNSEIDALIHDVTVARSEVEGSEENAEGVDLKSRDEGIKEVQKMAAEVQMSPLPDMSGLEPGSNVIVQRTDGSVDYDGWSISTKPEWDEKSGEWKVRVTKENMYKFVSVNQLRDWQNLQAASPETDPNQHAEHNSTESDSEGNQNPLSEPESPENLDSEEDPDTNSEASDSPEEARAQKTLLESTGVLLAIEHAIDDKMFNVVSGLHAAKEGVETGAVRLRQKFLSRREAALERKLQKYEELAQNSAFAGRRSKYSRKARWARYKLAGTRMTLDRLNTKHGLLNEYDSEGKKVKRKPGTEERVRTERHLNRLRKKEAQKAKEAENVLVSREKRRRLLGRAGIGKAAAEGMSIEEYRKAIRAELQARVDERLREAEQRASSAEKPGQSYFDRARLNVSEYRYKQSSGRLNKVRSRAEKKVSLAQNRMQKAAQRYASNLTAIDRRQSGDS